MFHDMNTTSIFSGRAHYSKLIFIEMAKMVIIIIVYENKYLHMQMGACVIHVYTKQNTFAHLRKVCKFK